MLQKSHILLIGSTGYLGRTLMAELQQVGEIVPTHRSRAYFADSLRYDFWTDDIQSLVERSDFPHPRDTSLDITLMQKLTDIRPLTVWEALRLGSK